ncbi:MAG: hypothetical protein AAF620_01330 [Bacteroidota bacterium]
MTELETLKKQIKNWSGFELEGSSEEELINQIENIAYDMEMLIDAEKAQFISKVKELFITAKV